MAYHAGAGSMSVTAVRGFVMILLFGFLAHKKGQFRHLDLASLGLILAFSACNVGFVYLYETSIKLGGPSQSLLLLFTHPILVLFIQIARGCERLKLRHVVSAILCFGGIALAADPWGEGFKLAGLVYGFASAVATAGGVVAYDLLSARRRGTDFLCLMSMGVAVFVAIMPAAAVVEGPSWPIGILGWLGMLASSLGAATGFYLFVSAISMAGAAKAILATNIEPIIGILCAALIVGEALTPHVVIGAIAVIFGLVDWYFVRQLLRRRRNRRDEASRAASIASGLIEEVT